MEHGSQSPFKQKMAPIRLKDGATLASVISPFNDLASRNLICKQSMTKKSF